MTPKYLALFGGGITVVGGGAVGSYFLMREKPKPQNTKNENKVVPPANLRAAMKDVSFLKTEEDTQNTEWGKLVEKFLQEDSKVTKIVATEIVKEDATNKKDANIAALKKACGELLNKKTFVDEDKEIAKNWCASSSSLLTPVPGQA